MKDTNFNSDRLQAAISELRNERVPEGLRGKTFETIQAPNRRRSLVPALASSAVIAAAILFAAWPSQKAMAWPQVVQQTLNATRFHRAEFKKDPRSGNWVRVGDFWLDGPKHALLYVCKKPLFDYDRTFDSRCDGKRTYNFRAQDNLGEISDETPRDQKSDLSNTNNIETWLSSPYLRIASKTKNGHLDGNDVKIYSGQQETGRRGQLVKENVCFYVRPDIGKIIRMETLGPGGELTGYTIIDYPAAISPAIFLPPKGVRLVDLDLERKSLEKTLASGVPFGEGNTLRAILEDASGRLTIIWTGTPPNRDLMYPIVVGHVSHRIGGNDVMTTSNWTYGKDSKLVSNGQRLVGLNISLDKPINGPVTLQMPVLVENKKDPIRDSKGEILGYRSKLAGTCLIKDFPVRRDISLDALYMLRNGPR